MSKVASLGIIGCGFVGGAVASGFKHYTDVKIYDINADRRTHPYEVVIKQDIIVMSLPTPMHKDGSVDTSIVDEALVKLNDALAGNVYKKWVILRSTVPPGALHDWYDRLSNINLIFSPEFLTERTAELDFQQSNRIILGVGYSRAFQGDLRNDYEGEDVIEALYRIRFPMVPIYWVDYATASLTKYFTNVFFCTKLSLLNEFAQVAEAHGLDFNNVMGLVMLDQRIGRSHFKIPGHDGKRGFSGSCFPKDCNGYLQIAESVGVDAKMGRAAWKKNLEVREDRDWEKMPGRAVSSDEQN